MVTTASPRGLRSSGERRTSREFSRESSPKSRGLRTKSTPTLTTRSEPTPARLFAYEDGSLPSDLPLSRLLRMSLHSLRGYLEIIDLCNDPDVTTFADVMVRQRYAQCRQLASFVEQYGYSADDSDRGIMALRVAWIQALAELDQGNIPRFIDLVAHSEQLLEDACLETAMEISCDSLRDTLHEYALNIYGAQERLEEHLTRDASDQPA